MPGRQAHGRPLLANPAAAGGRKKSKKSGGGGGGGGGGSGGGSGSRGLRTRQGGRVDVLALAEQQIGGGPKKLKGVRMRDLDDEEVVGDAPKRRRGEDDEDEDDDEEGDGTAKRRRTNNDDEDDDDSALHSDSSGNEWREGVGADDDDSEIDSDEAFGESDDELFDGFSFGGGKGKMMKKAKVQKQKKAICDSEDDFADFNGVSDEDVGDDGADLGDEAIDLAAALDIVSSDEEEGAAGAAEESKFKGKGKGKKVKKSQAGSDSEISDSDVSGSGSDDSDEDSGSESDSESASDSDDDDDDDDEDMQDLDDDVLQGIAAKFGSGHANDDDDARPATANPYAFALQDLDSKDRTLKKTVQMTALAPTADAAAAAPGKKTKAKTLAVPLAPMLQDREERQAAADKAHETLDRWTETVKQNRRADHVQFAVAGSLAAARIDTVTLTPALGPRDARTELERTVLSIMEASGLGPRETAAAAEGAALGVDNAQELSPEELKAILNQKRRARALQSAEVARAKRIKKIKSKAYRRIRRREKAKTEALLEEAAAEDGGEDGDSEADRDAAHRRRALERMGARHRDSKWAKRAKGTNRAAWDDEFRAGMADMARQSEALRRRVEGRADGDSDSDADSSSESESDLDDDAFRLRTIEKLNKAGQGGEAENAPLPGLMAMPFMQRAEQVHKKANDEAVAELLRELGEGGEDESADDESADEDDQIVGRRSFGLANAGKTAQAAADRRKATDQATAAGLAGTAGATEAFAAAARAEAAAALTPVGGAAPAPSTATATATSTAGDGWEVVGKSQRSKKNKKETADGNRLAMDAVVADLFQRNEEVLQEEKKKEEGKAAEKKAVQKKAAQKKNKAKKTKTTNAEEEADDNTSSSGTSSDDDSDSDDEDAGITGTAHHRVNRANAALLAQALGDDDGAAAFARDKARQQEEEATALVEGTEKNKKGKRNTAFDEGLPGWGSWAGEGISQRARERQEQRRQRARAARDQAVAAQKATRRDAKLARVVIREARVKKNDAYLAPQLPHTFESAQQYERSLRLPVGPEWTTKMAFQAATKPRVLVKQGVVLPMAKPQV